MSSKEDEYNDGGDTSSGQWQKHRKQRACDICRRKKIRCDGAQMPGNRCSNCISRSFECAYVEEAKKRSPPNSYIEDLENKAERLKKLERLLRRLHPDEAVYNQLYASLDSEELTVEEPPVDPSPLLGDIASKAQPNAPTFETVTSAIRGAMEDKSGDTRSDTHDGEEDPTLILAEKLRRMALSSSDQFFGKSSGAMLIRRAFELKSEYIGDEGRVSDPSKPALKHIRPEFWGINPWEYTPDLTASPNYDFPDLDLALHCIDLYFLNSNLYMPLLHRPTFDKSVKERLYLKDNNFAAVFLLVCAVGARYSDNPRVRLDGIESHHSAGWKWYEQVEIMNRSLLVPPTLYDLQVYCLCILFLHGSSTPQACWTLAGIGIRLAQDVGVHRRKLPDHTHTPDDELWKRAFWVLVCADRIFSFSLGRPCAIQDEDFDLDLPVDCDDEYWDHLDPEKRFKQPPNKPSSVTSFIFFIKLQQVLAFSLRTIYSINRSKILLGFVGQQWEPHIIAELDSALNRWVDSVPNHLCWDPNREDDTFFNQSVLLYATYYHIQIIIHRPFIPSPGKPSPLSFPSLAICTNAARSCSHVVDIHRKRNSVALIFTQMPIFTSGIVLLLSIWGGRRSGLFLDPHREMDDVHKCMKALKTSERRLHTAGRLWDILCELACVEELPLHRRGQPSMKREREWDSHSSNNASDVTSRPMSQNIIPTRVIASPRRVRKEPSVISQTQQPHIYIPQHQQSQAVPSTMDQSNTPLPPPQQAPSRSRSPSQISPNESKQTTSVPCITAASPVFALPVYSNDLASLPLHGQMTFGAQAHLSQLHTNSPQLDQETSYWYTSSESEPSFQADTSGEGSYMPHYPSPPVPQQQSYPHRHHAHQDIPEGGFPSASEPTSVLQGPYGMRAAELASGMLFDAMEGRAGYAQQQQTSTYGLEPTHSSIQGMETGSTVSTPPQSSSGSSYRGTGVETMSGRSGSHYQDQRQGVLRKHEQLALSYPFVLDNDAVAVWSNAPTGFHLNEWNKFFSNFGELTQGNVQDHSGGQYQHQHQHEHQRVPQQHEQHSEFELDNEVPTSRTSVSEHNNPPSGISYDQFGPSASN